MPVYTYFGKLGSVLCQTIQQSIGFCGDSARAVNTSSVACVVYIVQLSDPKTTEQIVQNPV